MFDKIQIHRIFSWFRPKPQYSQYLEGVVMTIPSGNKELGVLMVDFKGRGLAVELKKSTGRDVDVDIVQAQ